MDDHPTILPPHNPFIGTIHHGRGKIVYFSPLNRMKYDRKSPYLPFLRHAPASRMLWDIYNGTKRSTQYHHIDVAAEHDLKNGNWIFVNTD